MAPGAYRTGGDRRWGLGLVILLLLVGLVVPPGSVAHAASPGPSLAGLGLSSPREDLAPTPAAPVPANCTALSAGYDRIDAPYFPPPVSASLLSSCDVGRDSAGLYFVSNATYSGSRFEATLVLPPSDTSPASAYPAFWIGMWVAGVPCSYNGESYLTVDLLPPYSAEAGAPASANWSLVAPVWDLVTPGACDPQCQNDTAFFPIAGRSYCEDDAELTGIGSLHGAVPNRFVPGDTLSISFWGGSGAGTPLAVYVNDTTHPSSDLAWSYPGGAHYAQTVSGLPLTPFYSSAAPENGGWTGGLDVGFGWQNCPDTATGSGPAACNSYNAPVVSAAGTPQVERLLSWNASRHAYVNGFPWVATASSSGACSGAAGTDPCFDFSTQGGTGVYPLFSLNAQEGHSWWQYGSPGPFAVSDLGGTAAQFPANANLSSLSTPTVVSEVRATVGSTSVTLTARVSDPNTVTSVVVRDWWCVSSLQPEPGTFPAVLSGASGNTVLDGNWSVTLPTHSYIGNLHYSITTLSLSGAVTGPVYGNATVTGAGTTCGSIPPPAPTITPGSVEPVGGGYSLAWTENQSYWLTSYTVSATPTAGGSPSYFSFGNVSQGRVTDLLGNTSYTLRLVATNPAGSSPTSVPVTGNRTFYPLHAAPLNVTITSLTTWVNRTVIGIRANATGGDPSYLFAFEFGDGTNQTVFTSSDEASVAHSFLNNYSGVARLEVTISDSAGDVAVAPISYVEVLAGPLAPSASIAAGNGFADVRWTSATAPPGVNVSGYTVYWTTDPSWAPYLTAAWPNNTSVPALHERSVTGTFTTALSGIPDGTEVYAQVVPWDVFGAGLLPVETTLGEEPLLSATTAPFASPGIGISPGGGTAPLPVNFSTEFTVGTGTTVVNATYDFTGGVGVAAPVAGTAGTFWANASYRFETPGLRSVYLYATDSVSELLLLTGSLYVAPAPGPVVALSVHPTPIFVRTAAQLTASATGGSGEYSYTWDLGNGENATGVAVSATYPSAGSYLIRCTVMDTLYGGSTDASVVVSVYSVATVQIGVVPGAAAGEYHLAAFASGGYGNLSYAWLFGDGTGGSGSNVTHNWTAPGTYNVTVRVSDDYGHSTIGSIHLEVTFPTAAGSSSQGTSAAVTWLLIAAIVVLAAVLAVALLRRRRRPPSRAATGPVEEYREAAPAPDLEEETPPVYR